MTTLAGGDAQALHLAAQAVAIGKNRRTFTEADFVRVIVAHLPHGRRLTRETDALRRRAETAEAEARELRRLLVSASPFGGDADLPPRRVVELNRSQYDVFLEYCEGTPRQRIAAELGLAKGTVTNYVAHVSDLIGADSAHQAAALVNRRVVEIRVRAKRGRAA